MTDPTTSPKETGIKKSLFVQIPIDLIQYVRSLKLTGTQYNLWLYLWERDPYGDRWVDIPSPLEIAICLKVDARTIQRAARRLIDCELFDFQIDQWKCRNTTVSAKVRDQFTGKAIRTQTSRSKCGQKDPDADKKIQMPLIGSKDPLEQLEPLSDSSSNPPHTPHTDPYSLIDEGEKKMNCQKKAANFSRLQERFY